MAKELPYYKHEPSEWLEGEIQVCSDAAIVCFTNLCSGYWLKLGCISYAFALHKYCRKDASLLQELIDNGIVDILDDKIRIKFLDKQLEEFNSVSEKRRQAANNRWSNANALQLESKSNAIREDKIREDKKKEIKKSTNVDSKKTISLSDRKTEFVESLRNFSDEFDKDMLNKFFLYWSEEDKSGKKMKWEMEKTWNLKGRLTRWKLNNFDSQSKPMQPKQDAVSPAHQPYVPIG